MQGNQDTFYLTLPSNGYDTIYRDNTPGRFKAKLLKTISLLGREWEGALSSISFPSALSSNVRNDYQSLVDLDFMCGLNLCMKGVKDDDDNFIFDKEYWIQGNKMKYEMGRKEKGLSASKDGVDFWNRMIYSLTDCTANYPSKQMVLYPRIKLCFQRKNITDGQNFHGKTWVVHTG